MTQESKTKADIVADIRKLAESCLDTATDADYFGGWDADLKRASRVLLAGSAALALLANEIDGKVTS